MDMEHAASTRISLFLQSQTTTDILLIHPTVTTLCQHV